jgi:hypothetical protein
MKIHHHRQWLDSTMMILAFLQLRGKSFFLGWAVNSTPTPSNPGGSMFFCQGFLS